MMTEFPLHAGTLESSGFRPTQIELLIDHIARQIKEARYPGATLALARHGELVFDWTFGDAGLEPDRRAATPATLWLVYSNSKVIMAAALWVLAEARALTFDDRVSDHIPGFGRHGKDKVRVHHLLTHCAGFPNAVMPDQAWEDRALLRDTVCDFALEWPPGSRSHYHPASAHWVAAALVEAVTGADYRSVIHDRILAPLGLDRDIVFGVPTQRLADVADMHALGKEPGAFVRDARDCSDAFRRAGIPGGGAFASARGLAAFYQMLLFGGGLAGRRILSPQMIEYATRDWTGGLYDEGGETVQRGLGPQLRGHAKTSGFGSIAPPQAFGHGGAGSSIAWGDPLSGVSFAYITNCRQDEAWHRRRMDVIGTMVHAAIL
jgi:CubicO group peptidase (beta-lactamase class C family)